MFILEERREHLEPEGIFNHRRRLWTYALIAIGLSVLAIVGISFFTMDHNTFKAISHISVISLIVVLVLVSGKWVTECIRYKLLIRAIGKRMSFGKTAKAVLGSSFTGAITPYRAGTFPAQVYFLSRYGLTGGEATAVSLTAGAISMLVMMIAMPFALVLGASKIHVGMGFRAVLVGGAFIGFFAFLLAVYSMRDPSRATKILNKITPRFIRRKPGFERFQERLAKGMGDFSETLRTLFKAPKLLLVAVVLLTVVFWLAGAFVASWLLKGFGYPQYFWKAMLGQMLVSSILPFAPVPAESGVAEVAFAGIFSVFIAKNTLAFVTIAWRFFMLYIPLIGLGIAFILATRDARRISLEREQEAAPHTVFEIPVLEPLAVSPEPEEA